jgi:CHAT domain-containing protein
VQQRDVRQALETAERARARALLDLLATRDVNRQPADKAADVPGMIGTARRLQSTLLVYWLTPDAVYIWTIAPDGAIHDARVDVPLEKVIGLVAATRAPASQDAAAGMFALKAASSRRPWRELHDLLIAPVRTHLPKSPDALITIVPHGPLAQLSFAALQDDQGSYLLERYTLHYTPAVGVLAYTAKHQGGPVTPDARSALLVGDPGELPAGLDGAPLSALPWARREVTEVAELLGGTATVLTDAEASEAAVRDRLSGRSLLHFATHGIVREDETLGSFLALRGDAQTISTRAASSATDGRLTADEVYELKLDADLVVLSACSSALGPTGTEGVIGFTRAFLYAGAASVIATSWNVPDASSYELMHRFYRARRDTRSNATATVTSTARALRAAQLSTLAALRQGEVTISTSGDSNGRGTTVALPDHPLFWAGFIVVGEP